MKNKTTRAIHPRPKGRGLPRKNDSTVLFDICCIFATQSPLTNK